MKSRYWELIPLVGVIFASLGWFISNAENIEFIQNLVTRNYINAKIGFKELYENEGILSKEDQGFQEISRIILEKINYKNDIPEIYKLETTDTTLIAKNVSSGEGIKKLVKLKIYSTNYPIFESEFVGIDEIIEEKYFHKTIFEWSKILFWIGIIIIVFDSVYKFKNNLKEN